MGRLNLALLGTPEVRHDGEELVFPTRKALAMLIYLGVERGKHSREKLVALFWPDSDEERGRGSLRRTLVFLRRSLGVAGHDAQPQRLITEHNLVSLNPECLDVDLWVVETALAGRQYPKPADELEQHNTLLSRIERASALCRGDFLEGFSLPDSPAFDEWLNLQREAWHYKMGALWEKLSQLQAEAGETAKAIAMARLQVAHDPFNEAAHRNLMRLHIAIGERGLAERAYKDLRGLLQKEWGAEPSTETEALAALIGSEAAIALGQSKLAHTLPPPTLIERHMVGRATEFGEMIKSFRAASDGQPQMVVLEGEAGIGKTRLATEFVGWAAAQGASVLQSRAFEMGGRLPYQPVVEAIRSALEAANAPEDLLDDVWLVELSRLLPELRERYPDLPPPAKRDAAVKSRLFEAVARLTLALAEKQPMLFFMDDVQWADAASLDLALYLVRRWADAGARTILLLGVRAESLHANAGVQASSLWLAQVMRELPSKRLELGALTADDTLRLVLALAGEQSGELTNGIRRINDSEQRMESFGRRLFNETGGQPFFIVETLKSLQERGSIAPHRQSGGDWVVDFARAADGHDLHGFVAPGIVEMLRARLSRLTPDASSLLVASVVIGRDANFETICSVVGLTEERALLGFDELLNGRLLREIQRRESASAEGRYIFAHDKIRDVVYSDTAAPRKRIFHRRALEALLARNAPSAELAHHALYSGQEALAFHLSLAAGDAALRLFAVHEAISQYERAHLLVSQQRAKEEQALRFSGSDLKSLYSQLGRAYELTNEWQKVRSTYEEMLALAVEQREPSMECAALNRLATLAAHGDAGLEPMSLLAQALRIAEESGDRASIAETEWTLAHMSFVRSEAEAALKHGERALELSRELGLEDMEARSLDVLAYASTDLSRWESARDYGEQARTLYAGIGNKAMEADSLCVTANGLIHLGYPQRAADTARKAQTIGREIENSWGQVSNGLFLTLALTEVGEYQEGLEIVRRDVDTPPMLIFTLARLGGIYRALLSLEAALEVHHEALVISETPGLHWWFAEMVAAELCADYCMTGDLVSAYPHARRALSARSGTIPFVALLFPYAIETLVNNGDMEGGAGYLENFRVQSGTNPRLKLSRLRASASLAQARGQSDEVVDALREASALAKQIPLPGEEWQIETQLAEVHHIRGERDMAQAAYTRAREITAILADRITDAELRARFITALQLRGLSKIA